MLSKLFTKLHRSQNITQMAQMGFKATPMMNKKPSIGDAVTILQSKVSNINQVVSFVCDASESMKPHSYSWPKTSHI